MNNQWDLDDAENAAERKEFVDGEKVEVHLKRKYFNWLSREHHGRQSLTF